MKLHPQSNIDKARRRARQSREVYHVYPINEEAIHNLKGGLCFCMPEVEDYTVEGGGVVIAHQKVTWQ